MKISTILLTASFLVASSVQEDGLSSTTFTDSTTSTSTTTEESSSLITLPPASCASAGFSKCYNVVEIITPTVYVILTVDETATVPDSEPITSGDPIFSQTGNIATATDQDLEPPTTAIVIVSYFESTGTTCGPTTTTSVLADDGDTECMVMSTGTLPFITQPDAQTKTRVVRKVREDDTQGKGTETGGGGGQSSETATPGSTSDENIPVVTSSDPVPTSDDTPTEPGPTDGPAPTTQDASQPTEGSTEGPIEGPTGTNPTSAEDTPQETENPTGTTTTFAPDASTTIAVPSSSTSASEETSPSDYILPITDSSTLPFTDSTSTPTEDTPTSTYDSNSTPTDDLTTQTSGQGSSRLAPTGQNESGKPEITTAFTTFAQTSDGTTRIITSAVATMTNSAPSATTSGGSGVGSNFLVKAQLLFGAVGLAAVVGL